jgi:hypothetical protein
MHLAHVPVFDRPALVKQEGIRLFTQSVLETGREFDGLTSGSRGTRWCSA